MAERNPQMSPRGAAAVPGREQRFSGARSSVEFTVEKLVYGGKGMGRVDGQVVMVPFVLPGERVRAPVMRRKPGFLEASRPEILEAAPERIAPACPLFTVCGGCQYLHASYAFQLEQKREILRDVLRRIGKLPLPEAIDIVAGPPLGYRNRSQFHLAQGKIGFLESASRYLVPVEGQCPVSSPKVNSALSVLREMMRSKRFPHFVHAIEVFTNEDRVQLNVLESERAVQGTGGRSGVARGFFNRCSERLPGANESALDYPVAGEVFRVGHRSFFQINRFLIERLAEVALEGAEGEAALDLYAGVGLFTIPMAKRFSTVVAVESSPSAAADLEYNLNRAGVRASAVKSTVELHLASYTGTPDFVLADPPRAGLGKHVAAHLLRLRPRRLHIVACDVATLARDLGLLHAGGYHLESLTMVDLFPQTGKIETVAKLILAD